MQTCVVGSGYVGLVTGSCIADSGQRVVCADVDASKIDRLRAGDIPIFEPGLAEMIATNAASGRLTFTSDVARAITGSSVVFVAVGTPSRGDGSADLSAIDAVAKQVADAAEGPTVLVLKSTVPVGTNARVRRLVENARARIEVVSNPEFLKEGDALSDFMRPDRVVIGVNEGDEFAREMLGRIYHPFTIRGDQIVWTDPPSAEMTKYVANTILAMRISFMNEVAALCEKVGADVHSVRLGVGSDSRIGPKFLYAGPGYGGSCFPKDVKALVYTARDHGLELELAAATDRVNDRQKGVTYRKVRDLLGGDVRGMRIGVWGLAFKPQTDDVRESPGLALIETLLASGAEVIAHDPEAMAHGRQIFGDRVEFAHEMYDACGDADALVLVTEWRQYRNPDFDEIGRRMRRRVIVDARSIWNSYGLGAMGFKYDGIGVRAVR